MVGESIKLSLLMENRFIKELFTNAIKELGSVAIYENVQLAQVVIFDLPFLTNHIEDVEKVLEEKGKKIALIDYDLSEQELVILIKLLRFQGILHKEMSLKLLEKFFQAIARDEIWIPRSIFKALLENKTKIDTLSYRELLIINYLLQGLTNKEIAFKLDVSEQTVKYYLNILLKKLNCFNRAELIIKLSRFQNVIKLLVKLKANEEVVS
jgi:two-component system nitrate/nitrite response regulator NarP